MQRKKVWRYYCDFCRKSSGRKDVMEKHERRCTLNPERECGFCLYHEGGNIAEMEELKTALTEDLNCHLEKLATISLDEDGYPRKIEPFMEPVPIPKLRSISDNCPGCILAAIRQMQAEDDLFLENSFDFDFRKEADEFWREDQRQQYAPAHGML